MNKRREERGREGRREVENIVQKTICRIYKFRRKTYWSRKVGFPYYRLTTAV